MNFYVFLKVFAEICLYYGCIRALPALFPFDFLFLWPALVCAASAAIGAFLSDHGRNAARIPLLLLAASTLFLGDTLLEWMILIPPVFYTAAMILRDEWALEYFHFRDQFRKTLVVLCIALVVVHCGVLIESRSQATHVLNSGALLRHLLLYGFCGIILQLQLRLGSEHKHSHYLSNLQILLVTVCTAALAFAIVVAERFLRSQGLSLGQLAGHMLQIIVGVLMSTFQYLFIKIAEMIKTAQGLQYEDLENTDIDPTPVMPMEEMEQLIEQTPKDEAAFPWWLAVLILAALTVLLILLTRVLRSRQTEPDHSETVAQIQPKAKPRQPSRRSNRSKLRRIYREFLKTEKRRGHRLQPWHTSQDILDELPPDSDSESAARLRSIYLSARYDLNTKVTPEQVQAAKDALKAYRSE